MGKNGSSALLPPPDPMRSKKFFHAISTALTLLAALVMPNCCSATDAPGESQALIAPAQVPEGLKKSDWQRIRAAHDGWLHEFRKVDDGWQAFNPGQQWTTTFDGCGFLATPKAASWTWGLELRSYGFGSSLTVKHGMAVPVAAGPRLTYRWQNGLEEWFVNDERGLEHGYTVPSRPEGAREGEALVFTLSTLGCLMPSVSSDQQTVHFRDEAGAPVLNYSKLKVWDADGMILPSRFERSAAKEFRLLVEETGARYPLTIDPMAQQAYLKASNSQASDRFGWSVAVSGDTVVVGANGEDSITGGVNSTPDDSGGTLFESGAAYVFVRSGGSWSQQAYLKASNPGKSDRLGESVAVSGDTVVVGARQEDSSTPGVTGTPNESASNSGAAYVFVRSGGSWSQQAYLKASNPGVDDLFGTSVAVSGDTVVVGAHDEDSSTTGVNKTPNEGATDSGAAYVFVRNGNSWSQQAYLKASNPGVFDYFGSAVAVSGDTVVVGANSEDSSSPGVNGTPNESAIDSGAVYVFVRSGGTWSQQAYLKASNPGTNDAFGRFVGVSGDTVVVGAPFEDSSTTGVNSTPDESASDSGAAYVFVRSGVAWSQQAYLKDSNPGAGDNFGTAVAVSGDIVVAGAWHEASSTAGVNSTPDDGLYGSGAAYVFLRSGNSWSQQAYLKASNPGETDCFGLSVGVSGGTVVVGAYFENSSSTGVNSIPNESAGDAGAAYIFTGFGQQPSAAELFVSFATNAGLNGADAIPDAMPFHDGVSNLLKYAFNMNPKGPDTSTMQPGGSSGLPSAGLYTSGGSTVWRVEYVRRKDSGLIYTPQISTTLAAENFEPMTGTTIITDIDAEWQRVAIEEPYDPASTPRSFVRLKVAIP